jgi:D-cysteine desulfhydrase
MKVVPSGIKRPWLFEVFPEIQKRFPWTPLVNAPTPVERLERLSSQIGKDIWIKRDDKTSPIYGGNKPRKLEFILADASASGRKQLVTGGGLGSNHALATAIFGQRQGFKVAVGLFPQPVTEHVRMNLLLDHVHGAEMIHCSSLMNAVLRYYLFERVKRPKAYFIPPGGSNSTGTLGYVDAALELAMQLKSKALPSPEAIFVTAGTCGTVAGLLLGLKFADVKTRIIGVQVAAGMFSNPKTVLNLANKTLRLMRRHDSKVPDVKLNLDDITFEKSHLGEGYGYQTELGKFAMKLMADAEGIQLDQTYTAKTFGALLESVKNSSTNGPVLFWHTFNSIDLSQKISEVDPNSLPIKLRSYFEGKSVT